jgi:hypothetical protein
VVVTSEIPHYQQLPGSGDISTALPRAEFVRYAFRTGGRTKLFGILCSRTGWANFDVNAEKLLAIIVKRENYGKHYKYSHHSPF